MKKKYEAAMTGFFMYVIAMGLILLGLFFFSRGNSSAGIPLSLIGLLSAYSWNKYSKRQQRKGEMRDAFIEAEEERKRKK